MKLATFAASLSIALLVRDVAADDWSPEYAPEEEAETPAEPTEQFSTGLLATGSVFTAAGVELVGVGLGLVASYNAQAPDFDCRSDLSNYCVTEERRAAATTVMVLGGIFAAGGIAMMVIGSASP